MGGTDNAAYVANQSKISFTGVPTRTSLSEIYKELCAREGMHTRGACVRGRPRSRFAQAGVCCRLVLRCERERTRESAPLANVAVVGYDVKQLVGEVFRVRRGESHAHAAVDLSNCFLLGV